MELEFGPDEDGLMKRSRFTEEQIIAVLKEYEVGAKIADLTAEASDRGGDTVQLESQARRHGCV